MPKILDKTLSGFKKGEQSGLIPALQAVQDRLGYLPKEAIRAVAGHCGVPESTVFGVATFYEQFHLTARAGTRSRFAGARPVMFAAARR